MHTKKASAQGLIRACFLKILGIATLFLATSSYAQLGQDTGGPFIDDQLPWGYRFGGGGNIVGPMFPGFGWRRTRASSSLLGSLTSGSAVFDNGSIFSGASLGSGFAPIGLNFRPWIQTTTQVNPTNGEGFKLGLGPLVLYDFMGGAGAFYTDYNTPSGIADASGWSSVVSLSTSAHLQLPFLSLAGRLSGYYLPNKDEWGYGTPSPFAVFGFGNLGFLDPGATFYIGTKGNLAGWDFVIYDSFVAETISPDLTSYLFEEPINNLGVVGATLPQATAADRVGRYQFGGGAFLDRETGTNERFSGPRFGNRGQSFFSQDRMWFTNSAGVVVGKMLTPSVRNLYWFRRDDIWATNQFNPIRHSYAGGAYIDSYGSVYFRPYAGYEFGSFDDFQSMYHIARTGSWGFLTPDISYAANIGWVWTTGQTNNQNSAVYELMLAQSLGSRFQQYLGGGRTVSDPTFGERYLMDYLQYGLSYLVDSNTVVQLVTGVSQGDGALSGAGNSETYHAGLRLRKSIGNSFFSVSAVNEHYDFHSSGQEIDQWVYKAIYSHPLSPRTSAWTGYQFIDRYSNRTSTAFSEHLFIFYVTQRF